MRMFFKSQRRRIQEAEQRLSGWLEPDDRVVACEQLAALRRIWVDATAHVPYYRNMVQSGRAPQTIESIEQFCREVPTLCKRTLVTRSQEFKREDRNPDGWVMTAGSTGEPLHLGVWASEAEMSAVNGMLGRLANGVDLRRDRLFLLWGHSHLLGTGVKGKIKNVRRKIYDFLLRYKRMNAYRLDKESARRYFDEMMRFRPQVFLGYSSAIDMFVRHNEDRREQAVMLGLKMIIATAEMLSRDDSREKIEWFFSAPLVMEYGGVDFGVLAYQRPGEAYRTFWWNHLLEVSDQERTEEGTTPLVVTSLYKRYTPLIRYYVGDEISGETTSTNGQVLRFESVAGRYHDVIDIGGGSMIHSVGLFHCIHQEESIVNIQLTLEPNGMRVILVGEPNEEVERRIRRRLSDLNSKLFECKIEFVADVQTNLAGKRRWIIDHRERQKN